MPRVLEFRKLYLRMIKTMGLQHQALNATNLHLTTLNYDPFEKMK